MAVGIAAMLGAALLLAATSSLTTTDVLTQRAVGQGLANQLMEQISLCKYCQDIADPYQSPFGPGGSEGPEFGGFNDIDDFDGFEMSPPKDRWGIQLGVGDENGGVRDAAFQVRDSFLQDYRVTVDVFYVDDDDPSIILAPGSTSDSKAVEINVYVDRPSGVTPVATLRRVFTNIHQSP